MITTSKSLRLKPKTKMNPAKPKKENNMKKKLDRKDKLIMEFKEEVKGLMEKFDVSNFLTCLRIHKMAFILDYNKNDKEFIKMHKKMSPEEHCEFLDKRIPPFFTWKKETR